MTQTDQTAAVIPCRNEARTIATLVREARAFLPAVYVIDDASTDSTAAEARRAGAKILSHPTPSGKGAALATGFAAALSDGFSWALAMDGDGQHDPADIPTFLARANPSQAAMIIGNRMADPAAMPLLRRFVNRWMSRRLARYCGIELPDSQCGFRLLNLHAWNRLSFAARHFEIESELIVRFAHAGFGIDFVPVQTRYGVERSKISPLRDTFRWFQWWRAIRAELSHFQPAIEPLPTLRNADSYPSIQPVTPAAAAQDAIA